jgi:large conductance mechanosensitive channel
MKKFLQEFKEFAITGNMVDLAIGMIIGGAFTTIVKSLVDNICMPIISLLTGGIDFSNMFIALNGEHYKTVEEAGEVALIKYGSFITDVISFLLLSLVVFIVVKNVNKLREMKKAKEPEVEEAPTEKECPYCFTKININATRCPHCTSQLSE